jgi:hypothetical protein
VYWLYCIIHFTQQICSFNIVGPIYKPYLQHIPESRLWLLMVFMGQTLKHYLSWLCDHLTQLYRTSRAPINLSLLLVFRHQLVPCIGSPSSAALSLHHPLPAYTSHVLLYSAFPSLVSPCSCWFSLGCFTGLSMNGDFYLWLILLATCWLRLPLWSGGKGSWLQIQRSQVRFLKLLDFLSSSGSGTGSTQPCEYNWGATWKN